MTNLHSDNQDQTYSEEEDVDTIIKRIEREFIANKRSRRKQPGQQKRSTAPRIQEAADALLREQLSNVQ